MLDMSPCPTCHGARIRKESMHVFLTIDEKKLAKNSGWIHNTKTFAFKKDSITDRPYAKPIEDGRIKYNIDDLQHMTLHELVEFMDMYIAHTEQPMQLAERIIRPLLDRARIIDELGLDYITLHRPISTLSGGEIQRLRLAKQLGNKLTGIIYVLDEPTIGLSDKEIQKTIHAIKKLQTMGNTIVVVEHQDDFIKASDWVVEIGPGAGDFGGNVTFNGSYDAFIKSDCLTAQYITGKKKVKCDFNHHPSNKKISIKKANKFNLANIDVDIRLGSFTIITGASGAGKTTLMYSTLYKFLSDKQKFVQSYIRLQMLKK